MTRTWWSLVCVLALGVSACDGGTDPGDPDSGPPDAGPPEAPPLVLASVFEIQEDAEGNEISVLVDQVAPDLTCLGTATAPTGSGESTFTILARDFFSGSPVEGLGIQFFPNNAPTLDGTCTAPCQEVTSGADGTASVTGTAGAWYAYRVAPGSGTHDGTPAAYLGVLQINETTPDDGGSANLNVVQVGTQTLILQLLGTTAMEGTTVVTGQATDCQGRPLANTQLRVFDSTGEIMLGFAASRPRAFYFSAGDPNFPAVTQRRTNVDGLYGAANVPQPADNTLRLEIWGTPTEGGEPVMIGCEEGLVSEGGLQIINVGPTRADGPSNCSGS